MEFGDEICQNTLMKMNIGISDEGRKELADELGILLASSYTLYIKTHGFHWNVTGPMFQTLHLMFEQHYNELALAVDLIAERIRALGFPAPASYAEFSKLSEVKDAEGNVAAQAMIQMLTEDHETIARLSRRLLKLASKHDDDGSADVATGRLTLHEKTAWMLRSLLG